MKTISFKTVSEMLSEKELKNILGGSGDWGGYVLTSYYCCCAMGGPGTNCRHMLAPNVDAALAIQSLFCGEESGVACM